MVFEFDYTSQISLGSVLAVMVLLSAGAAFFYNFRSNVVALLEKERDAQEKRANRLDDENRRLQDQVRQIEHANHAMRTELERELATLRARPDYTELLTTQQVVTSAIQLVMETISKQFTALSDQHTQIVTVLAKIETRLEQKA